MIDVDHINNPRRPARRDRYSLGLHYSISQPTPSENHMPASDLPTLRLITARSRTGEMIDVLLDRGVDGRARVKNIAPGGSIGEVDGHLVLDDHVLLPPAADPHAHLDKALSWNVLNPQVGDLGAAIDCWRAGAERFDEESFYRRAHRAATTMLERGTTAVRTHVDVLADDDPYRAIRAIDRVRHELRPFMTIQIALLAPPGTPDDVIHGALDVGADLVGGAPHIADDPVAEVARLIHIAETRCVGVDLHTDEFLAGDHTTIGTYAELVAHWPADVVRTAGHCCRLSTMDRQELSTSIDALRNSGISVVALPITNLYLQGRADDGRGAPRGIAPLSALADGGVRVAAGADNIRDPFNPMGSGDALETASLLVTAGHQIPATAIDLVTSSARSVLGLAEAGPVVGALADFMAVRGADQIEAMATTPDARVVIVDGRIISRTKSSTWSVFD